MTVITVTTVGYGETLDGHGQGRSTRAASRCCCSCSAPAASCSSRRRSPPSSSRAISSNVLFASQAQETDETHEGSRRRVRRRLDRAQRDRGAAQDRRAGDRDRRQRGRAQRDRRRSIPKAEFAYIVGDATDDDVMAQANLAARARPRRRAVVRQGQPLPHGVGAPDQPEHPHRRALRRAVARREDQALGRRRGGVAELHRRHAPGLRDDAPGGGAVPRRDAARHARRVPDRGGPARRRAPTSSAPRCATRACASGSA